MTSNNSRIPKIPDSGRLKRPNENMLSMKEKRSRLDLATPVVRPTVTTMSRSRSVLSINNLGTFSERAKRAALQPPKNTIASARDSMPANTAMKSTVTGRKPKRPAWDLKGRIQDMEDNFFKSQKTNEDLKQELDLYNKRIVTLEQANNQLHHDNEIKSVQSQEATSTIQKLEKSLKDKNEEMIASLREKDLLIGELKENNESLSAKINNLENNLSSSQLEATSLKSTITSLTSSYSGIQSQLESTKILLLEEKRNTENYQKICEELRLEIENKNEIIKSLDDRLRQEEMTRRRLHNTIQELKGNIRVFCRIRPPLPEEGKDHFDIPHIRCIDDDHKTLEISRVSDCSQAENSASAKVRGHKQEFVFDRVFDPSCEQAKVFDEISQLVQSVLDGYNVCIFAYGQTGSGKTYTMEGPGHITDFVAAADDPCLGMIPRAVQQIFLSAEQLILKGWRYTMESSCLEIYNESIKDLLVENNHNNGTKCAIKMSAIKGQENYVSNMTTVEVTSCEQVYDLLRKARTNRSVAATNCNERSSRSHYVFQMRLAGENRITSESCEGILNLVDLAGSERIKVSGSAGERLTEAKNINKSLSNLGNVIMALSQKADHIPYRNSKLTHLLMNSLGGNSKTLMFVNINPDEENMTETLNSLRFATKVNQCNIGTAQKKVK